jgi:hypothetical protein
MTYRAKHPAAFINALSEGPKAEVIEWLQRTWDELQDLRTKQPDEPAAVVTIDMRCKDCGDLFTVTGRHCCAPTKEGNV